MNRIVIASVLFAFCAVSASPQIHLSGRLSGELVDTTYIVDGDIWVEEDTLIIHPGAVLRFDGPFNLQVSTGGSLFARGTAEDSVIFVPNTNIQSWNGLFLSGTSLCSRAVRLQYCRISGCDCTAVMGHPIYLTIDNCAITGNHATQGGGLNIGADLECRVTNSLISGNSAVYGGGICAGEPFYSSIGIDIVHCAIIDNSASMNGGGIYCGQTDLNLSECEIIGNTAGQDGGGIYYRGGNEGNIVDCHFSFNTAGANGGGIYSGYSVDSYTDCRIDNNYAGARGGAGFFRSEGSDFERCLIDHNYSPYVGGLCFFDYFGRYRILNCTITSNFSPYCSAICGDCEWGEICNSVFADNSGAYCLILSPAAEQNITHNCFHDNSGILFGFAPVWLGRLRTVNANGDSCDIYYIISTATRFS